jgi:hypothetical protein
MDIGIIDSGIDRHFILANRIKIISFAQASIAHTQGRSFLEFSEYNKNDIKRELAAADDTSVFTDATGHGTNMVRLITRNCIRPSFIICKIFDDTVKTYDECFIAALDWMIRQKPDVINLSIGCFDSKKRETILQLTRQARKNKIIICCAGYEEPSYPALFNTVITVVNEKLIEKYRELRPTITESIDVIIKNNPHSGEIGTTSEACALFTGMIAHNKLNFFTGDFILSCSSITDKR